MLFVSTRGEAPPVTFEQAVLEAFPPDGGLYVPQSYTQLSREDLGRLSSLSFAELTTELLLPYVEPSMTREELLQVSTSAFSSFSVEKVVPISKVGDYHVVELFHGPTLSFKDLGQSFLLNVLHFFLSKRKERRCLLVATSGDTGPAAVEAAKTMSETVDVFALYPKGMISDMQSLQMDSINEDHIKIFSVLNATSDELDTIVKSLLHDKDLCSQEGLSCVNSFNVARVLVQSIHFFFSYLQLDPSASSGSAIFSVPTGAFGDMFGGIIARQMGLPVAKFVVATNSNDVIPRFFSSGTLSTRPAVSTHSNAMDICVPYNFERFLHTVFASPEEVKAFMQAIEEKGQASVEGETMKTVRNGIFASGVTEEETLKAIGELWSQHKYAMDPHTAVGWVAMEKYDREESSTDNNNRENILRLVLATAHPAKFPNSMKSAIGSSSSSSNDDLPVEMKSGILEALKSRPKANIEVELKECYASLRATIEARTRK